jgi:hypothetical protein
MSLLKSIASQEFLRRLDSMFAEGTWHRAAGDAFKAVLERIYAMLSESNASFRSKAFFSPRAWSFEGHTGLSTIRRYLLSFSHFMISKLFGKLSEESLLLRPTDALWGELLGSRLIPWFVFMNEVKRI